MSNLEICRVKTCDNRSNKRNRSSCVKKKKQWRKSVTLGLQTKTFD
jgi:hypothetical protein